MWAVSWLCCSYLIDKFEPTDDATNLFLRENGKEILQAMLPQLQKKLSQEFSKIGNALLKHVPIEDFLKEQ